MSLFSKQIMTILSFFLFHLFKEEMDMEDSDEEAPDAKNNKKLSTSNTSVVSTSLSDFSHRVTIIKYLNGRIK